MDAFAATPRSRLWFNEGRCRAPMDATCNSDCADPADAGFAVLLIALNGSNYNDVIASLRTPLDHSYSVAVDYALPTYGARPPSRDRGLRSLRSDEDSSGGSDTLWLFRSYYCRHHQRSAHRF